jgi:hypothetical protein
MSALPLHPVDRLIELAQESASLMWSAYEAHIAVARYDPEWRNKASEMFARCSACDDRMMRLKYLRAKVLGPRSKPGACEISTQELAEAEWRLRKLQLLLQTHHESQPRDARWKEREISLMEGLKKAVSALAQLLPSPENED